MFPRIFKGVENEEIEELKQPMVRSKNAKEIVENVPGCEGKYLLEEYAVFTPEGYILILHRLIMKEQEGGQVVIVPEFGEQGIFKNRMDSKGMKPPVLLNHGAMMTSEAWLTAPLRMISDGKDGFIPSTLPHVLLNAGYDVWISNRRGNKYSCKHTTLSTHDPKFWSFSLDEPACRDLPTLIDFIREVTEYEKISLIGFSQGAAESLAALSMIKGLEKKVNIGILLAPTTKPRGKNKLIRFVIFMF